MSIINRHERRQLGREIEGMAACLLPFEENGDIAEQAFRDAVVLNAAAGLHVLGLAADLKAGAELAGAAIDSGAAMQTLKKLAAASKGQPV